MSKWTRLGGTLFRIGENCNEESWKVRNRTPPKKRTHKKLRNKGKRKKGTPTLGGEGLEKKLVTGRKKTSSRSQPVQINFIVQGLHIIVGKTYLVWHPDTESHSLALVKKMGHNTTEDPWARFANFNVDGTESAATWAVSKLSNKT